MLDRKSILPLLDVKSFLAGREFSQIAPDSNRGTTHQSAEYQVYSTPLPRWEHLDKPRQFCPLWQDSQILMIPAAFKSKWQRFSGKETAAYQEHFNDLCRLLQQPTPAEADPSGNDTFCFQKYVLKDAELFSLSPTGEAANDPEERGFADV